MIKYSIIICSFNRFEHLSKTIESAIQALKSRKDYELLIIDNNSTDNTAKLNELYNSKKEVKYYCEINQGLSHARNRGITEATGEILIYLDDDISLPENYFEICDSIFDNPDVKIAGGKVLPYKVEIPEWLPKKFYYLASVFDIGNEIKETSQLMGGNCALRKEVVEKVGKYDISLGRTGKKLMGGEENDYFDRARRLGYKLIYNPELFIFHKINDKLNKNYILEYAYHNGLSNSRVYKENFKRKHLLKIIKAELILQLFPHLKKVKLKEKVKINLEINERYSKGYMSIL